MKVGDIGKLTQITEKWGNVPCIVRDMSDYIYSYTHPPLATAKQNLKQRHFYVDLKKMLTLNSESEKIP